MTLGEILLRVGSPLVGWMIVYAHCLMLGVLGSTGCVHSGDELWRATLILALPGAAALWLVPLGRPWRTTFRWFALPMLLLLPLAAMQVMPYLTGTTLDGLPVCDVHTGTASGSSAVWWQRIWAPAQGLALAGYLWLAVRGWWPGGRT